jgi:TolB-like protein/Flp pilus assembly protein TadD
VIAVLPLRELNAAPDTEYFTDGLTDEIIYNLSIIDGLEVKSGSSSFVFKGKAVDAREAGRQLGSDLVLEGTVLRGVDRLRLNIQLVRVADDVPVWSQQYDRGMRDIFAVQDEVSRAIVNELRLKGDGGQRRYRTDPDTYDLYLQALSLSHENAPGHADQIEHAAALLKEVAARDRQFVPAYAALAEVYAHFPVRRYSTRESLELMREATKQAIALDPLLPQALATLGLVQARELRWQDAEAAFRRALELDPNLATARSEFATFVLEPQDKITEAVSQVRRAVELDPLSPSRRGQLIFALLRAGATDEALALAQATRAAYPNEGTIPQLLARALMLKGRTNEALALLEKLGPSSHAYLGYAYASVGRRDEAAALAAEHDPMVIRHRVLIYAALGEFDRCFEALNQLAHADDAMADLYPGEPELAFLRNDQRMRALRSQRRLASAP